MTISYNQLTDKIWSSAEGLACNFSCVSCSSADKITALNDIPENQFSKYQRKYVQNYFL